MPAPYFNLLDGILYPSCILKEFGVSSFLIIFHNPLGSGCHSPLPNLIPATHTKFPLTPVWHILLPFSSNGFCTLNSCASTFSLSTTDCVDGNDKASSIVMHCFLLNLTSSAIFPADMSAFSFALLSAWKVAKSTIPYSSTGSAQLAGINNR